MEEAVSHDGWKRAVQAASRLETGKAATADIGPEYTQTPPELSSKERKARRATFLGKLNMGIVGKERDETEELPYTSKALEQQHWCVTRSGTKRRRRY